MRVLIAGGGIGGLALAIALRRRGLEARVFERAPQYLVCGAAQTLWPNGVHALRELGLDERVVRRGWPLNQTIIRTPRGRVLSRTNIARVARRADAPAVCIRRAALQRALIEATPREVVTSGVTCAGFEDESEGVTLRFENGKRVEGDVLVGADGLKSVVRGQMLGTRPPRRIGHTLWRCIVPFADAGLRAGHGFETWSRGVRFGAIQVDEGHAYWYAAINTRRGQHRDDARSADHALLMERFGAWHEPIPALLKATRGLPIIRTDIVDRRPLRSWWRGRVALLGDAAHPMTPDLGQGACQAIEDAVALADCLARTGEVRPGLAAYERRRWRRAASMARQSFRMARLSQLSDPVLCWARDVATRATPQALIERALHKNISAARLTEG